MRIQNTVGFALLLLGCAGTSSIEAPGPDGSLPTPPPPRLDQSAPYGDAAVPFERTAVFAHSSSTLYRVDPDTLAVVKVADFVWPGLADQMTDLAVDRDGQMIGISFTTVYSVDPKTAACTRLAPLARSFNGLSFISADGGQERLLATAQDGSVFEIDPKTGQAQAAGSYGGGLLSSGDLVSVKSLGTVATVKKDILGDDWLARVDPATGKAQLIGATGFTNIWGLGFWKNQVYGFTQASQFVLIDVNTGKGQLVTTGAGPWWGAAVTTTAPVIK